MEFSFDRILDRRGSQSIKWHRYGEDVLPLWVADMDFQAPEPVRQALRQQIDHGVFGYELPSRPLLESVAARMERLYGWKISLESIVAVPGIVAGFKAAARAVCQPGEGVLVQPPVYHPFLDVPRHTETVGQLAPLKPVNSGHTFRYEMDWAAFENAVNSNGARTAMFLLCQPHNPTGQIHSRADLKRMAEICQRNNVVICSDEIHSELLLGGARHIPLSIAHPEAARRAIMLVSPSKTFNVVGLFCGFAIIPNPALCARYRTVIEHLALHVNSLGLTSAAAAFSGACEDWLEALRDYLTGNRDLVVEFVSRELKGVRVTVPEATYLAWLDFGDLIREEKIGPDPARFLLEKAKVALTPGVQFGVGGEHCARLNFGCPRPLLLKALEQIRNAL